MERIQIFHAGRDFPDTGRLMGSRMLAQIAARCKAEFALLCLSDASVELGQHAEERFLQVASMTSAGIIYADYF